MPVGPAIEAPVAWLSELSAPAHACYEAGPTGYGLYRAAVAGRLKIHLIALAKALGGPSDRVKTDAKTQRPSLARDPAL
jgi:transposase